MVLANSNPATIMTDPEIADRTYIEPLTLEYLEEIIRIEREMDVLERGLRRAGPLWGDRLHSIWRLNFQTAAVLGKIRCDI